MTRNYKQLHSLLGQQKGAKTMGLNVMKCKMAQEISRGRTTEVKQLNDSEYNALISNLKNTSVIANKLDKARKRVIASIFGFFNLIEKPISIEYVKAIAVRATGDGCKSFNAIPESKLRAIYNEFLRQQKVVKRIGTEKAILKMPKSILSLCGIELKVKHIKGNC